VHSTTSCSMLPRRQAGLLDERLICGALPSSSSYDE
jgi:hypothetical protein